MRKFDKESANPLLMRNLHGDNLNPNTGLMLFDFYMGMVLAGAVSNGKFSMEILDDGENVNGKLDILDVYNIAAQAIDARKTMYEEFFEE